MTAQWKSVPLQTLSDSSPCCFWALAMFSLPITCAICFSFIYASFKHTVCYHDHVYTTMYIQNTASYKFMFLLCPGAFIIHLIFIHVLFMPLYGMTMERDENKGKERETVNLKGCSYLAWRAWENSTHKLPVLYAKLVRTFFLWSGLVLIN